MSRKLLIGVVGAVIVTVGLAQGYAGGRHDAPDSIVEIRYHQSIGEWIHDPVIDHIVIGRVTARGVSRIIPDTNTPLEVEARINQNGGVAGSVVTDYVFQVSSVLKGTSLKAGDMITIVQGGGSVNGHTQDTGGTYAAIEPGERAVLSLVYDLRDPTVSSNTKKYTVISQPEVRYRIVNGKLELMPGDWQGLPKLSEFVALRGMNESDFAQKMLNALRTP